MSDTARFDQEAGTWDQVPRRVVLAREVAEAIKGQIPFGPEHSVLDFGCGTGLVTLALAPLAGAITGADTSGGMLEVLAGKARELALPVALLPLDPTGATGLGGPYDVIVSSMTLHHVEDVAALFGTFAQHLHPGGRVALADLDEEDGTFHDDPAGVHHRGFSREDVRTWLAGAGFLDIHVRTATVTRKNDTDYSIFLAVATRS